MTDNRTVKITIDGKETEVRDGLTLLKVLRSLGIKVPTLCYHDAVSPYGACRLCLVEVTMGTRTMLAASCLHKVSEGLIVRTASERVLRARKMVAELLLARCPNVPQIQQIAAELGVTKARFRLKDEKCVLCGLCVRGCRELAGVGAIDFANRGVWMELAPPFHAASEACVGCTTCVYLCPTGTMDIGDVRGTETPHPFEEKKRAAKCALCVGYRMNPDYQELEEAQ